jgi:signal transduction histidine kinase
MNEVDAHDDSQQVTKSLLPPGTDRRNARAGHDALSAQILLTQELERQRIAIDLHDGLGPLITLIKLELQNASKFMGGHRRDLGLARAAIRRAEENVARTFDELRRTVLDLRPAMLDDFGVVHALRWLIRQFELSGSDAAIHADLLAEEGAIPRVLKIVIFRVCQEALNNVIKHANASRVTVALTIDEGQLQLSIEDNGGGIDAGAQGMLNRSGGGLAGIILRATSSQGKVSVVSAAGNGTRITILWPLASSSASPESGGDDPLPSIISH